MNLDAYIDSDDIPEPRKYSGRYSTLWNAERRAVLHKFMERFATYNHDAALKVLKHPAFLNSEVGEVQFHQKFNNEKAQLKRQGIYFHDDHDSKKGSESGKKTAKKRSHSSSDDSVSDKSPKKKKKEKSTKTSKLKDVLSSYITPSESESNDDDSKDDETPAKKTKTSKSSGKKKSTIKKTSSPKKSSKSDNTSTPAAGIHGMTDGNAIEETIVWINQAKLDDEDAVVYSFAKPTQGNQLTFLFDKVNRILVKSVLYNPPTNDALKKIIKGDIKKNDNSPKKQETYVKCTLTHSDDFTIEQVDNFVCCVFKCNHDRFVEREISF